MSPTDLTLQFIYRLARAAPGRHLLSWMLSHMSFVIPSERLRETPHLLAFYHPRPVYPVHILILPKKALGGLDELSSLEMRRNNKLFYCEYCGRILVSSEIAEDASK